MPTYKTIIAKNKKEAYQHLMEILDDHTSFEIIREGIVKKNKKRFFKKVVEEFYEIQIARYNKDIKKTKLFRSKNITAEPKKEKVKITKPTKLIQKKINYEKLIGDFQKRIKYNPSLEGNNPSFTFKTDTLAREKIKTKNTAPNPKNIVVDFLVKKDFSLDFAKTIKEISLIEELNSEKDFRELAKTVGELITIGKPISNFKNPKKKKVIFFVGPTGVGKTTTLCKIASSLFFSESESFDKDTNLQLGSFDVRRLMAISQLEKFASILNVGFHRFDDKKLLINLLNQDKDKGIYLIDTSGISLKEQDVINETIDYLDIPEAYEKEVVLCINANQRYQDLKKFISTIDSFKIDQLIITKIDDSSTLGTSLSVIYENKFSLSYVTNGQDIPNDIRKLDNEILANLLLEEWLYEKSN